MNYIRSLILYGYVIVKFIAGTFYFRRLEKKYGKASAEARKQIHLHACHMARRVIAITGSSITVRGAEHIPDEGAVLFVGNHQSYFDSPAVLCGLAEPTGFIAKDDLAKVPCMQAWFHALECVLLTRGEPRKALETILQAAKLLQKGNRLVLFAEGTRSADGILGEFKAGGFKAAQKGKAALIPVAIDGTKDVMPRNSLWTKPHPITVTFFPAIEWEIVNKLDTNHLAAYTKAQIASVLGQSLSPEEAGLAEEAVGQIAALGQEA